MTTEAPASGIVAELLAQAGLRGGFSMTGLPGGGNNRVYRVDCSERSLLLKAYFHHPDDPRDRLAAEFAFSQFAWSHGLRCIPQALARDDRNHIGLYEFIHGQALEATEIGEAAVEQAIEFFAGLNRHKSDPAASRLPHGSEACFTLAEHLACVERRIDRLVQLEDTSAIGREAKDWIHRKLHPAWEQVRQNVIRQSAACGFALDVPIPDQDRCLSPSDFGFHNAILARDGRLRFVDFEYAGWDDPAKTACDFLCQPKLPMPGQFAERFTAALVAGLSDVERYRRRISLLLPVYQLKWCCIMMNEFLPVGSRRRSFAHDAAGMEQQKRRQLEKARRALQEIET